MNIRQYQITNHVETNDHISDPNNENLHLKKEFTSQLEINMEIKDMIIEAMLCNNDTRMEATSILEKKPEEKKGFFHFSEDRQEEIEIPVYEPKGSPIEVGITQFLIDNDIDVQEKFIQRNTQQVKLI